MNVETRSESDAGSGVLQNYRILERLDWIQVDGDSNAKADAKKDLERWCLTLEALDHRVLWTRCLVQEEVVEDDGVVWASVWLVAGVEDRNAAVLAS